MTFDARAAKLLKPGEHITVTDSPGLRLVAGKTRRSWIYRYKSPLTGLMKQVAIGQWPAVSYAAAVAAWEVLRDQRGEGQAVVSPAKAKAKAARPQPPSRGDTVADIVQMYITEHIEKRRKPKGQDEIKRLFKRHITPKFGALRVPEVKRADAYDVISVMEDTPIQARMLKQELGAAWDLAIDSGRVPEETPNHWRQIFKGRLRSKGRVRLGKYVTAKRVLSDEEVGQVLRWMPNFSRQVADVLQLYLWTAMRGSEICSLRGEWVAEEADGWWVTVPVEMIKIEGHDAAYDHRVPLIGRALEIVLRRKAEKGDGWLFPRVRKVERHLPTNQKSIATQVWSKQPYGNNPSEKGRAKLPVSEWAPHDLRRTTRTQLSKLGCPRDVAEAVIGHMPTGIVGVYDRHTYDKERREWLAIISSHYEALAASAAP
ncbi:tyrosine-type recombinase/integrase [Comamonas odontotermitis]|uniref:tyrosine-type recombinase/integrase n=1 Tax=Comamonas odontotermitis TaxID=379895 RepID=UPI0037527727